MENQQLGDFGRSTKPSQKYYSKPLFRRWFSFHSLFMSFIVLGNEIFNPCILKSYELGGFLTLLMELIVLTLAWTYIDVILFTLEVTPEGISQFNRRWSFIKWEEFKSIKVKKILGSRILSVQGVKKQSPILIFARTPYEKQQLLQCIQSHIKSDHPLAKALEQEIAYPQQRPHRMAWGIIAAIALLISTWLVGGNLVADRLGKPLEQAIVQYNSQHPTIAPNESAHQLQALLVKFGLSLDHFDDGSKVKVEPQKAAIAEWQQIELLAHKYLSSQIDTIEDKATSSPLPLRLLGYLQIHRNDIKAVYDYWINNPLPYLGQGHSSANTWILLSLQTIESIDLINKTKEPNADITRELKALQQINLFLRSHHVFSAQTAKLGRSIQNIPAAWEEDSFKYMPHRTLLTNFREQTVSISNELQNPANIEKSLLDIKSPWWWIFRYHHLVKPYLRVAAADHYQKENEYISRLEQKEVCHSSGSPDFQSPSPIFSDLLIPLPSRIFFQEAISDLQWELTNEVRQVRSEFAAGQKAAQIASEFNLPSQVCLGEKWSAQAQNNTVTISFSHPPNWKALGMQSSFDRLTYTVHP